MQERRDDPYYFEAIKCEDCETTTDLYMHGYNERIKRVHCINDLLKEAEEKENGSNVIRRD